MATDLNCPGPRTIVGKMDGKWLENRGAGAGEGGQAFGASAPISARWPKSVNN